MFHKSRIPSILLYATALFMFAVYLYYNFSPNLIMAPLDRLLMLGIVCVAIYVGSFLLAKSEPEESKKIMKITFAVFFALYLMLLTNVLFFDRYFGRTGIIAGEDAVVDIRLTPFSTIVGFLKSIKTGGHSTEQIVTNLLGNFMAFTPFALFLPLFSRKLRRLLPFSATVAGMVIAVELLQIILKTGVCDIDDLILNLGGAVLAFTILKIKPIKKLVMKFTKLEY